MSDKFNAKVFVNAQEIAAILGRRLLSDPPLTVEERERIKEQRTVALQIARHQAVLLQKEAQEVTR